MNMETTKGKQPKRRIKQNVWGNWHGYEGTKRVREFSNSAYGSAEQYAEEWVERRENEPNSLHSMSADKSVFHGNLRRSSEEEQE